MKKKGLRPRLRFHVLQRFSNPLTFSTGQKLMKYIIKSISYQFYAGRTAEHASQEPLQNRCTVHFFSHYKQLFNYHFTCVSYMALQGRSWSANMNVMMDSFFALLITWLSINPCADRAECARPIHHAIWACLVPNCSLFPTRTSRQVGRWPPSDRAMIEGDKFRSGGLLSNVRAHLENIDSARSARTVK